MIELLRNQMSALGLLAGQNFVDELVDHLFQFAPDHARSLGPAALRPIVEIGVQRAKDHGFTQRGPIRYYIELMFLLGSDFDTDLQFPWASSILNRPWTGEPQVRRASELFWLTNRYLEAAAGPRNQFIVDGLRRAQACELRFEPASHGDQVTLIREHLRYLAPEKCAFIGDDRLDRLIRHAQDQSATRGGCSATDHAFIAVLMFGLGWGCLKDPQFPWVGLTFQRRAPRPGVDTFEDLRRRTLIYLRRSLENTARRQRD